ncbi:MAG: alkaline phosphatase family protein [Pirellulales bacterium]
MTFDARGCPVLGWRRAPRWCAGLAAGAWLAACATWPVEPGDVHTAYIGPGAGIALAGTFLAVLAAMLSAALALLVWPIRWAWRAVRNRRARGRAKVGRVVILGLDGLDPVLVDRFMAEGWLPNLERLGRAGTYTRLGTTWPPLSPVAWSSFSTGVNPGKHNIFDFVNRNPADYRPLISSVQIRPARRRLRLGKFEIPLGRPSITPLRKSKPFWSVLGEGGVFGAVLRVPITFPPDRFHGVQLSAMCVPDLRGSQGTFCFFTEGTAAAIGNGEHEEPAHGDGAGDTVLVTRQGNTVHADLPGPANPLRADGAVTHARLKIVQDARGRTVLHVDGERVELVPHQYTAWINVSFRLAGVIKARGMCRFYLKQFGPKFAMYCTPIHIDPDRPVMPISHPAAYSTYLARQFGSFATLGLAEDTGSLSQGVLSEEAFLEQAYDIDDERQQMFFDALRCVRRGLVACVFDAPDRIQHMMWRFLDDEHPARPQDPARLAAHRQSIPELYARMDKLVGRTIEALGDDTALIVMSDHGFKPFRRCVDLNAWLREHGYLALKEGAASSDRAYLADVDWSRTRAYAIGLAGLYINQCGRESHGIVPAADSAALAAEIAGRLSGLRDVERNCVAVHQAVARGTVYRGPYVEAAPDVIVGYNVGYRVSWGAAVGKCGTTVFQDNTKAWSGDHCIHPDLVPGILFSNWKLAAVPANIVDIAPTALELLGLGKPSYMDGKSLLCDGANSSN